MKNKIYSAATIISISLSVFLTACDKNPEPAQPEAAVNYALMMTGGTYPNQTTYFLGTKNMPTGTVETATAAEFTSSGMLFKYGKYAYVTTFGAPATLRKYSFDQQGKPTEIASFIVQGLKTFGAVDFVSETEAYAASNGYGGVPKLVKFNPTTMQITGTIDLTALQKKNATQVFYLSMVHRDDQLFMGCNYQNGFSNLADSVYVAVIGRTSGQVEKLISDGRTGMIWNGGTASSFIASSLVLDENGDIYVHGTGNGDKVPSGVIRIKKGTTTFDKDYFLNLKAATGADCLGLMYYGNGKALTCRSEDANNYPFDGETPSYTYYKVDLTAKTSLGVLSKDIPPVFGSYAFTTKWDDNTVYLNVPAATSNSIYSLNTGTGSVKKEFGLSSGICNGFAKLN
ncbi:DUF4374 domain-containing protein [Spirosoma utsteinense]|uniref:DUF4374 domain-containing protein n=1 Tax=Spirosoma utsteinense TaxID=2585773 RepID=A0ABR6WEL0_9BACT|nr:DUF4374 domain-containing protein [Spirosoma utsteinense]MBC3789197.1 hypothetical protein [Spirosoma utsteinense]MBC3794949.1 hypothetical protein [Spirosoma utsteinense]